MEQAYNMAVDALDLALISRLESGTTLPVPSEPENIPTENGFLVVIGFDMLAYKKKNCSKAIKKTLSIPEWLNEEALAMNINFSQVLQDALLAKIQSK